MLLLVSNTPCEGIKQLRVTKISYLKFSIDFKYDAIIFTSKNAINAIKFNNLSIKKDIKIYCIGEATKKEALNYGFKNIFVSKTKNLEGFLEEIKEEISKKNILFLRAKEIIKEITYKLNNIKEIVAYRSDFIKSEEKIEKNSILFFTSPKNVEGFIKNFGWDKSYKAYAIGDSTKKALLKYTKPIVFKNLSIKEGVKFLILKNNLEYF